MEKFNGRIKFYDDNVNFIFHEKYENLIISLGELLGLVEENFLNVKLSYKDDDGDIIEIKSVDDYKMFIEEASKNKELMELLVEVKDDSEILIKKCSSSILNFVNKISSANINNASEEIKEKQKSLELSDEINPNNIPNEIKNEKKKKN